MISIITCFEKPIETITLALYRSLKKNLTGSADYRVYAIAPRPGFEPSADAISAAEELGIVYVAAPLNTEFKYYPLLNKAYACEYVARHYGGDAYLFLDSDTLFLNKMDLTIHAASEIAIRPVDYRNIGISDFREPNGPFWQSMYDFLAIKPNRKVLTATGRRPIFEYFNSGYVYTRKPVLFEIWLKLCLHLMKTGRRPDLGIFSWSNQPSLFLSPPVLKPYQYCQLTLIIRCTHMQICCPGLRSKRFLLSGTCTITSCLTLQNIAGS